MLFRGHVLTQSEDCLPEQNSSQPATECEQLLYSKYVRRGALVGLNKPGIDHYRTVPWCGRGLTLTSLNPTRPSIHCLPGAESETIFYCTVCRTDRTVISAALGRAGPWQQPPKLQCRPTGRN